MFSNLNVKSGGYQAKPSSNQSQRKGAKKKKNKKNKKEEHF